MHEGMGQRMREKRDRRNKETNRDKLKKVIEKKGRKFKKTAKQWRESKENEGRIRNYTVCFIDLGKLNMIKISLPWSKQVKQTVEENESVQIKRERERE